MADINSTLLKIKALADGTPYEYERESALKHLHKLMEKHGITEQDLSDEVVTTYEFKFRNIRERSLLHQVLFKVIDSSTLTQYGYSRNGRKVSNKIGIDCTAAQKIEIDFLYDFYKRLYQKEEKAFFTAFVNKHNLFGASSNSEGSKLSREDIQKMVQMMNGMDDATPYKQIEERSK